MAIDPNALGQKFSPLTKEYAWKDVVLYALGVGAGFSDLDYCYEKQLKVIPSFAIAAIFESLAQIAVKSKVNLAGILHGEQELIFHHPIPPDGKLTTEGRISQIYDKGPGKGALVIGESETRHSNGKKLFTSICTLFARLDGGFGGQNAPKKEVHFPERDADYTVEAHPDINQPLLYRLSGDIFALHVDPDFARASGFERPIMHGLCTHGFACRALIATLIPGEPEKARRMACRFSKPLYPGTPIETRIWKTGQGTAVWRTINRQTGEVAIDNGIFEYGPVAPKEIRFDGQVAVVTGAGSGLGRAYALELARRGAKVVVNDLGGARDGSGQGSSAAADQVVAEIRSRGGAAVANYDSVTTAEGGERIVETAVSNFGRLDILINNAGILRDKSFANLEPENWQAVLDVHLSGAYHVSRPAFAVMKESGYGRILMTTSAAGLYGNFGQANYAAAKMGLVGLMNTLKIEGQKYNILVNTVAPLAASRLTADVTPKELLERMPPEHVVPLVVFLCSRQCPVSGRIYNAGMGFFNRAAVVTGRGLVLSKEGKVPTAEAVADALDQISSLKDGQAYWQLSEQVGDALAAFAAPPAPAKPAAGAFASVADVFAGMPDGFVAEAAKGVSVVFQFHIGGDNGGDWFCEIENQVCRVESGTHASAQCTLKINDQDFLAMMNGSLPAMQAYTSGKLRIEGDIIKSQLIEKLFNLRRR